MSDFTLLLRTYFCVAIKYKYHVEKKVVEHSKEFFDNKVNIIDIFG